MSMLPLLYEIDYSISTEVVICDLVASFSFKKSDKLIKWDMGSIASSCIGSEKAYTLLLLL